MRQLDLIERRLENVYTALIVRDPGTPLSVDAYEGLRKQVVATATDRVRLVAQLAEFDVALARGATANDLRLLVDQWLAHAGVSRIVDPEQRYVFESRPGAGAVEVEIPGYVDVVTGRVVRQGRLRRAVEEPAPVPTLADVPAVDHLDQRDGELRRHGDEAGHGEPPTVDGPEGRPAPTGKGDGERESAPTGDGGSSDLEVGRPRGQSTDSVILDGLDVDGATKREE